jgi:hypothetical protein
LVKEELDKTFNESKVSMEPIRRHLQKYNRPVQKRTKLDPNAKPTFSEMDPTTSVGSFPLQLFNACLELGSNGSPEYDIKEIGSAVMKFLEINDMTMRELEKEVQKVKLYYMDMMQDDPKTSQRLEGVRQVLEKIINIIIK